MEGQGAEEDANQFAELESEYEDGIKYSAAPAPAGNDQPTQQGDLTAEDLQSPVQIDAAAQLLALRQALMQQGVDPSSVLRALIEFQGRTFLLQMT